jgi:WD40 repeat protein/serine/threonine protein kinase
MKRPATCPDRAHLRGLLASNLTEVEQSDLIAHLDSCESCQHSLEEVAGGGTSWAEVVRHLDEDRPASASAFWAGLEELQDAVTRTETPTPPPRSARRDTPPPEGDSLGEVSLDFLAPPEVAGALGRLGHFEVVEVIGRGGMGMVLKALDACLQRHVALKVLDPQLNGDEVARKRFCREARAAAAITHEHVVAIHQVEREEENDLPYLVMQYIPGSSLQEHLDRGGPMELREIVRIGLEIAQGLAAAHRQGLIHRDIKPANILLEEGTGGVKLTDFGLARAVEDVKLTQTGYVAGTPLYMAPEQARGEPLDHRTDLFSLGSVLYALCTGLPPFEGSTPFVVLKSVTEERPRPIQEINPAIPDWLVGLIDRLHAKKPDERVQSAAEVADLLAHQLALLPPSGRSPKAIRPVRRSSTRLRPVAAGLRFWGLVAGLQILTLGGLILSEASGLTAIIPAVAGALHWRLPAPPTAEAADAGPAAALTLNGSAGPVWFVAISPDDSILAMAIDDGTVKLWDPKEGRVRATLEAHKGPIWSLAFSPDGTTLATASDDGTVKLWDVSTWQERRSLLPNGSVRAVSFSGDGKRLVTGNRDGHVRIWDTADKREPVETRGHRGVVMSVAFSPDGKTVASAAGDKVVKLWDTATGQEQVTLQGHTGGVYAVAFSPDGKKVASGGWDKTVRLWDAASGNQLAAFQGHGQDVWGVAFAPDGKTLASASEDRTVKLWDVDTRETTSGRSGRELATFKGHTGTVYTVAFTHDGRGLASGSRDGTVKVWDVAGVSKSTAE